MERLTRICALGVLILAAGSAQADLYTGTISNWVESGPVITIGDCTDYVSLWWSLNTNDRGWFYGSVFTGDSDVAFATGVTDISQISDASVFSFTDLHIGPHLDADSDPDGVGDFIVWRNTSTNYYGVLRIDDIVGNTIHVATLNGTWWFQSDGTANFDDTIVPVPPAVLLGILGLGVAGLKFRKYT